MSFSQEISWVVSSEEEGLRLDQFLFQKLQRRYSNRSLKKKIEEKHCLVNGAIERFPSKKLKKGDGVFLCLKEKPESVFTVLFEDKEILCLDKPAGILTSLSSFSLEKGFLVHRLDKETSGLLLIAKTALARDSLGKQFFQRQVEKSYLALVKGAVSSKKGKIEGLYAKKKQFHGNSLWGTSGRKGTLATTFFRRIEKKEKASLLEVAPKTGKTHQIRAHLTEIGHPIIGDYQYGSRKTPFFFAKRSLLHAWKILFYHPISGERIFLSTKLPTDFEEALSFFQISIKNLKTASPSPLWGKKRR